MSEDSFEKKLAKPMTEDIKNLPGGPLRERPLEINGVFYDPFHPPKLIQTPDGRQEYRGGRVLDKDEAYSMLFWQKDQPPGLREAMEQSLDTAIQKGVFSTFVGGTERPDGGFEFDQDSKEKLSAYRILARERKYQIGPFRYLHGSGTAQATIIKKVVSS
jgi:hypothetical protein